MQEIAHVTFYLFLHNFLINRDVDLSHHFCHYPMIITRMFSIIVSSEFSFSSCTSFPPLSSFKKCNWDFKFLSYPIDGAVGHG